MPQKAVDVFCFDAHVATIASLISAKISRRIGLLTFEKTSQCRHLFKVNSSMRVEIIAYPDNVN